MNRKSDGSLTYDEAIDLLLDAQQANAGLEIKARLYKGMQKTAIIKAAAYCSNSMMIDGIATQACLTADLESFSNSLPDPEIDLNAKDKEIEELKKQNDYYLSCAEHTEIRFERALNIILKLEEAEVLKVVSRKELFEV